MKFKIWLANKLLVWSVKLGLDLWAKVLSVGYFWIILPKKVGGADCERVYDVVALQLSNDEVTQVWNIGGVGQEQLRVLADKLSGTNGTNKVITLDSIEIDKFRNVLNEVFGAKP